MRAIAVFPHTREVKMIECEEPHITQPDQIKLRMLDIGICGTDRLITAFVWGEPPKGENGLIIGHEALGQVIEVGTSATHLHPGDLAVIRPRRPCPHSFCRPCRLGRPDFCITDDFQVCGIWRRHGFMSEVVVDSEYAVHRVSAALREVGVLIEPLSIAEKALFEVWHVQRRLPWIIPDAPPTRYGLGLTAVVLGAGTIGLLGAMALVNAGFDTYVYDRHSAPDTRSEVVKAIGAHYSSPHDVASPTAFMRQVAPVDLVYEATGSSQLAFEVLQELSACGIFVFVGFSVFGAPIPVDADHLLHDLVLRNKVAIGAVSANPREFEAAIRDLETFQLRWPQALHALITERFPLEQASAALLNQKEGIKQVVAMSL